MQISLAPSRFSIPRTFNVQALRAWIAPTLLGLLKTLILLTYNPNPLGAQAIANRLWLGCIILIFWRETASIIRRPNLYVLAIIFWLALGVLSGNPIGDITADLTIMVLPAIFWRQLCMNGVNREAGFRDFCISYFDLNLIGVLLFSSVGLFTSFGIGMDWNFLIPSLLSKTFSSSYLIDSLFFLILFATSSVLSLSSKTALGNIAIAAVSLTRGRLFPMLIGIFIGVLVVVATLPFVLETQAGAKLTKLLTASNFSRLSEMPISTLTLNPAAIFHLLDISTAERVFELLTAVKKIGDQWVHIIFGFGMGAGLDLSNSHDRSVLGSHDNTQEIRVVHLAITWALLKGGATGLVAYVVGFCWVIWQGIANICSSKLYREYRWVWIASVTALLVLFSMQFAVSVFIKTPTLAIGLMGLALGRRLRKQGVIKTQRTSGGFLRRF